MADLRMITIGGDRPISVPTGVRMALIDELGRENVVFVPGVLQPAPMGYWDESDLPVVILSTQSQTLWSGAAIEWRSKEAQEARVVPHAEIHRCLRPLTLTVADLLAWARATRDPDLPSLLIEAALAILTWLGRPPMSPSQHAEWSRMALQKP